MSSKSAKSDAAGESARLGKILFGESYSYAEKDAPSSERATATLAQMFQIEPLESELHLPCGFFGSLLSNDDWSFVIKLHALMEAALTHLLTKHFGEPAIKEVFSHLEMSNQKSGKIAFARAAGLIDSDIKKFLVTLSELRNQFAHNVTNATLTLNQYFAKLKGSDLAGYRKCLTLGFRKGDEEKIKLGEDEVNRQELIKFMSAANFDEAPKFSIWIGALHCLSIIYLKQELAVIKQAKRDVESELARRVMSDNSEREGR